MYYAVVAVSTVLFGFNFLINSKYEKLNGSSLRSMLVYSLTANAAGFVVLFATNGFKLSFAPFTFAVALFAAVNELVYSYASLKSLGKINLSMYSVFAMLGGMTLPAVVGTVFYHEGITAGKILCFVFVLAALLVTVQKDGTKGGYGYYICVFVMNGMSGVYSKFFEASEAPKTSSADYSLWISIFCMAISAALLLVTAKKEGHIVKKSIAYSLSCGVLGKVGNYLLLIALVHLPASAQYPMVTGGVMIVSTLLCFFTDSKPKKREIISVILSFIGIIFLIAL